MQTTSNPPSTCAWLKSVNEQECGLSSKPWISTTLSLLWVGKGGTSKNDRSWILGGTAEQNCARYRRPSMAAVAVVFDGGSSVRQRSMASAMDYDERTRGWCKAHSCHGGSLCQEKRKMAITERAAESYSEMIQLWRLEAGCQIKNIPGSWCRPHQIHPVYAPGFDQ